MEILKEYKGYIPIGLSEDVKWLKINKRNTTNISLYYSGDQFNYDRIINFNTKLYQESYHPRLRSFIYGKGVVLHQDNDNVYAIICKKKVIISRSWQSYSPNEVTRFKKALRDNGWNTRKDVIYMEQDEINNFIVDPLSPTFEDYNINKKNEMSIEFLSMFKDIDTFPQVLPSVPCEEELFF